MKRKLENYQLIICLDAKEDVYKQNTLRKICVIARFLGIEKLLKNFEAKILIAFLNFRGIF
jgi:hypothetical protein